MNAYGPGWYIMTGNEYLTGPFKTEAEARAKKVAVELPGRVAYLELGLFNPRENTAQ